MTTDPITPADLTRELHYMQTQVEQHGFPGTRAVLAELERLGKENARLRRLLGELRPFVPLTNPEGPLPAWIVDITRRVDDALNAR